MKERIKNIIESLILKKFTEVVSVDAVDDISEEYGLEHLEHNYHVSLTTSKCLSSKEMMDIDTEVKTLFSMLGLQSNNPFSFKRPNIKCFFDCGDGEGYRFSSHYAYTH